LTLLAALTMVVAACGPIDWPIFRFIAHGDAGAARVFALRRDRGVRRRQRDRIDDLTTWRAVVVAPRCFGLWELNSIVS
jgi:hypothetical protein